MAFDNIELSNPNSPHRAVIIIQAEVHEVMPGGHCRGVPVHKDRKVLALDGQDRYITIRRLNELLQELSQKCQPKS
jgi:hypothetical protein